MGRSAGAAVAAGVLRSAVALLAVGALLVVLFVLFGQPARPAATSAPAQGASPVVAGPEGRAASGVPAASPSVSPSTSAPSEAASPTDAASATPGEGSESVGTPEPSASPGGSDPGAGPRRGGAAESGDAPRPRRDGKHRSRPAVPDVEVVVLNHTTTSGLAGRTADALRGHGWAVAVVGNFVGSLPESTVYYPPGRQHEARVLARRMGIARVHPAFDGVSETRLTVVLARDFPGA